jgi:hypothetical protein
MPGYKSCGKQLIILSLDFWMVFMGQDQAP